jgi:hypothetical protein
LCNVDRVVVQTEQEPRTAGELIRFWRTRRGLSQLLVHLAQHLDLPITERNRLLLAGGFAPPYLELPDDGEVMQPLASRPGGCSRRTSRKRQSARWRSRGDVLLRLSGHETAL